VKNLIRKFFSGNTDDSDQVEKKPPDEKSQTESLFTDQDEISDTLYRAAASQSVGRARSHNEDTLFSFSAFLAGMNPPVSFGIHLVADGMGGHQSGEIASSLATQGASQFLFENVYIPLLYEKKTFSDDVLWQMVKDAVDEAQARVRQAVPGGGTTLTLMLVLGNKIYSAHVGDSRLYFLGVDGTVKVRTKDHSLVKRLVDLGQITEKEASVHPQRNVLYRALGQAEPFEADIDQFSLAPGEKVMICSDGLWGLVSQEQLKALMADHTMDLNHKAHKLVQMANQAGGPDNISLILVEKVR
jgi:PPM family protein phosphatase